MNLFIIMEFPGVFKICQTNRENITHFLLNHIYIYTVLIYVRLCIAASNNNNEIK